MSLQRFDAEPLLLSGARFAARLPEGTWRLAPDRAGVTWRDGALERLTFSGDIAAEFEVAEGSTGYVVDTSSFRLRFGAAGIGTALARREPKVEAMLGMNGALTLRFCHTRGLWRLLRGGDAEAIRADELLPGLRVPLADALRRAVDACCGPQPWDREDLASALEDGRLRQSVAGELFDALYGWGLLAPPGEIRVVSLAYSPADGS